MALTQEQLKRIREGHKRGMLDHQLAQHASISISSVKRYRNKLGLETNSQTAKRGAAGEEIVAFLAANRGHHVEWRHTHNQAYDLRIDRRRVDCKAAMQQADGGWRFRLARSRRSFYGQYKYAKDYVTDCDVIALVCFKMDGGEPDVYFLESALAPTEIRVRPGDQHDDFRNTWEVFSLAENRLGGGLDGLA